MTQKDDELKNITSKLDKLEQHLINLIVPIQGITTVLRHSDQIKRMVELLSTPLTIDDRFFKHLLKDMLNILSEFKKTSEKLDISKTLSEIKYIGNRLNTIEKDIQQMKTDGVKRNINLEFTCDGYEMVKRPVSYEKDDPIVEPTDNLKELLGTLNEDECKVLIHRFGLFGEKKKTLQEIANIFGIKSREPIRVKQLRALRKLRHPSRNKYVDKITHKELKKAITGD